MTPPTRPGEGPVAPGRALRAAGTALLLALAGVGSITVRHLDTGAEVVPTQTETPFGRLASGSSVGLNATNASASVAGTLLSKSTDLWYLNNTNATGTYVAKISVSASSGVSNLVTLRVGIRNGTTSTDQVVGSLGSLTTTNGTYVTLPAASSNVIYAVTAVGALSGSASLDMVVTVADNAAEGGVSIMKARLNVT